MQESVKQIDGHYQLPLPWRLQVTSLPNNREMASKQLKSLKERLPKNHSLKEKYADVIDERIAEGYCALTTSETPGDCVVSATPSGHESQKT